MSWKKLFVNEEETDSKKEDVKKESGTKFPTSFENVQNTTFNQTTITPVTGQVSKEFAEKFMDAYETAFNNLNQPGYDFFEFFQSVIHGDINNPQTYVMAFGMGKGMEKNISKEKLVSQADFYISEINKIYEKNVADGNQKKQDLFSQKESENKSLTAELDSLRQQFEAIQIQIKDKENKLSMIDNKYQPKISEYESKLLANDFAKNKIVSTIETVKQGINQNIK